MEADMCHSMSPTGYDIGLDRIEDGSFLPKRTLPVG